MKKFGLYLVVVILGALGVLSLLRVVEVLWVGGLGAYEAGRLAGSAFIGALCLTGAVKALAKARAS